jgi:hypothetical protein
MSQPPPTLTFQVSVPSTASPEAVEARPLNYVPYWLKPGIRAATRAGRARPRGGIAAP